MESVESMPIKIGRPEDRHDLPFSMCLGDCGQKTLQWFYYCNDCRPKDYNEHQRDYNKLEKVSKKLRARGYGKVSKSLLERENIASYHESMNNDG